MMACDEYDAVSGRDLGRLNMRVCSRAGSPEVGRAERSSDPLAHEPPPLVRGPSEQIRVTTCTRHLSMDVHPLTYALR